MQSLRYTAQKDSAKNTQDAIAVKQQSPEKSTVWIAVVVLSFMLLAGLSLNAHEMWADEIQAWTIARDSANPLQVLLNARFEGHPAAWHECLFALSRITRAPEIMQVFNWLIAGSCAFVIAKYAPFSRLQRILLCFSYFLFYEFGTISRPYELGNLAFFAFCALYMHARRALIPQFILLALLANTSLYGFFIAGALSVLLFFEEVAKNKRLSRQACLGQVLLATGLMISGLQMVSAKLVNHVALAAPGMAQPVFLAYHRTLGYFLTRVALAIQPLWAAYFPVPDLKLSFWDTTIFSGAMPALFPLWAGCAVTLFAIFAISFARNRTASLLYVTCTGAMLAFGVMAMRHKGLLFVLLIGCFWLARAHTESVRNANCDRLLTKLGGIANVLFTAILAVQTVVAGIFFVNELAQPFSQGKAAASWIRENEPTSIPILGTPDWVVSSMSGWLDRPVYFCERMDYGTFLIWDDKTVYPKSDAELYSRVLKSMKRLDLSQCLFVKRAIKEFDYPQLNATKLASFPPSFGNDEGISVYLLKRPMSGSSAGDHSTEPEDPVTEKQGSTAHD